MCQRIAEQDAHLLPTEIGGCQVEDPVAVEIAGDSASRRVADPPCVINMVSSCRTGHPIMLTAAKAALPDHAAAASLKTCTASDNAIACRFRLSAAAADSSTSAEFCCVT